MGNRSKRGRRDPEAPDPAAEFQEEARWSGYTHHIRWPFTGGSRGGAPRGRLRAPTVAEWMAMFAVGTAVVVVIYGVFWVIAKIVP